MNIKCEDYNNVCVMALDGDLAGDASKDVRKSAEGRLDEHHIIDFVLDFEKCGFVDSEGLETLLWIKRRCEELFGQIKLINLDENCRKILEITRLEHRFECHGDLTAALKTMR